jgi:ribosomal protein S8
MTKIECAQLTGYIGSLYRTFENNDGTILAWYDVMKEQDYKNAHLAVKYLAKTRTGDFAPSISDVYKATRKIAERRLDRKHSATGSEVFQALLKVMRHHGYKRGLEILHHKAKSDFPKHARLGIRFWEQIRDTKSEYIGLLQDRFIKAFNEYESSEETHQINTQLLLELGGDKQLPVKPMGKLAADMPEMERIAA